MKKLQFLHNLLSIWGGVFCIVLLSCNNFLEGSDFKEQLEKDIAYANAPFHEIRVECDEGTGSILTETILSKKVTDKFNIEFKISSGYQFAGWKAFSKSSDGILTELSSEIISFSPYNIEASDGLYKVTATFAGAASAIVIKPRCLLLPKIAEITPALESSGCDQDSLISIAFNKAVDTESFFNEEGKVSCVSISSDGEILEEYFDTPYFSDDKKTLYFTPLCIADSNKLLLDIYDSRSFRDITVSLAFNGEKDSDGIALTENREHRYRINKNFGNQKKVALNISNDTSTGSFLEQGKVECTVGFYVEVQYTVNKEDYHFAGLEAVSSTDGSSRAEAVSFTLISENKDDGIYKYRIRVTEEANDILIRAVCISFPAVTAYTPAATETIFANMPIKITFNMPMETLSATKENSIFNWSNISITMNGSSASQFFEKPEFNTDKTCLIITPKTKEFTEYLAALNVVFVQVNVKLSEKLYVMKENVKLPLKMNENTNFIVRYLPTAEQTPPEVLEWFITNQKITTQTNTKDSSLIKFSAKTVDAADFAKIDALKNLCEDEVYFYLRCYDKDSGVQKVVITQKYTNDYKGKSLLNSNSYKEKTDTYDSLSENAEFVRDGDGSTLICIRHKIFETDKPQYGAVFLQVKVYDACENYTELAPCSAITHDNITQCIKNYDSGNYFPIESKSCFEPTTMLVKLDKNFKIALYGGDFLSIPYNHENLHYYCEYTDKNGDYQNVLLESLDSNYIGVKLNIGETGILEGTNIEILKGFAGKKFKIVAKYTEQGETFTLAGQEYTFPGVSFKPGASGISNTQTTLPFKYNESENSLNDKYHVRDTTSYRYYWKYHSYVSYSNDYKTYCVMRNTIYSENAYYYDEEDNVKLYDKTYEYYHCIYGEFQGPFTADSVAELKNNLPAPPTITAENLTYKKSEKNSYTDVIIDFGEDISLKYDSVKFSYSKSYYSGEKWVSNGRFITIPFSYSVLANTSYYKDDEYRTIDIVASKNGFNLSKVSVVAKPFSEQEKLDFDNVRPGVSFEPRTENGFIFKFSDHESGPSHGTISVNNKTYSFHPSDNEIIYCTDEIDDDDLYLFDDFVVIYDVYDKAGNNTKEEKTYINKLIETSLFSMGTVSSWKSESGWTPKFSGQFGNYIESIWYDAKGNLGKVKPVEFFKFNNNEWDSTPEKTISTDSIEYTTSHYELKADLDLTIKGSYFRKATSHRESKYGYKIFYTGPYTGDGSYNLLYANGNGKTSMAVTSDAPVFVHTIVTKHSYDECNKWSAEQWECVNKELAPKQLAFSDGRSKRYDIPVDEIESGECYVVIAHFADDNIVMGEVKYKD